LLPFNPYVSDIFSIIQDDPILKMNPAIMKLEANKAFRRNDYITAARLYNTVLFFMIFSYHY
jgi:hypothetical protein